ncbi:MAG: zinc-dependent alcohol dehydrogenase [Bacillota bacterium]
MKSKAIIFPAPYQVTVGEIDVPAPKAGEILTRTLYTGVSTGTETRVLTGKEEGSSFPLIPGYENVGEIVETGEGVSLKPGTRVFVSSSNFTGPYFKCWGAQVAYALSEADKAVPVPEGTDPVAALFVKTGAIALHGMERAGITGGDTVAVVGQGLIGHLAAQIAKAKGATVIAIDTLDERLEAAKTAGADYTLNPVRENVEEKVKKITGGGADVAVDVTGIASTVDQTARLLRSKPWQPPYPPSGRLVILGSYTEPVVFSYHPTLFEIEPDIYPSRDCTPDDLKKTMALIAAGAVKPSAVPARVFSYSEAEQAYQVLLDRKAVRIIYRWS